MKFTMNEKTHNIDVTEIFGVDNSRFNATIWQSPSCGYILDAKCIGIWNVIEAKGDSENVLDYVKKEAEKRINERIDELAILINNRSLGTYDVEVGVDKSVEA